MSRVRFPELLETLLRTRGVGPEEEADYLTPDYGKLHDPLLLPDMERARDRIIQAMVSDEHIVVYSDYDADGIPGAVVLSDFFRRAKYKNVSFYIPHRHDEGFGLNHDAMDECISRGAKLLITVDCGVADLDEVAYVSKKGVDVIVTDHHEPKESLPAAYAVVDPKRKDSKYPFKELCGAAVAYKLVQAILEKESFEIKPGMEKWSLDMVGIATLSDMVPLMGENRILARFGLEVLRKSPRPGLASLSRRLKLSREHVTEDDIAFMITPRINAASRMGKPEDAFRLLSTADMREAEELALHLERINNERKGIVAAIVKDAKKHLSMRNAMSSVIVIGNPEWRPSLLGLVANALVEEYERPAFVWGRDGDGTLKGSCRTCNGCDLFALMNDVQNSFIEFGGHQGAGGFSITLESITNLEEKLSQTLDGYLEAGFSGRETEAEGKEEVIALELSRIGEDLWQTVSLLAPFGTGNPKPIFEFTRAEIKSVRTFGKANEHLEITFCSNTRKEVKAISFFTSAERFGSVLSPGSAPTLRAHLEKSYFRNRPELRLRIVSIQ